VTPSNLDAIATAEFPRFANENPGFRHKLRQLTPAIADCFPACAPRPLRRARYVRERRKTAYYLSGSKKQKKATLGLPSSHNALHTMKD